MTRDEAFNHAKTLLEERDIDDAALEAEVLLRHTLNIDRASFYAGRDADVTTTQLDEYRADVERRLKGMPTAYITGAREFFGLEFFVDESVLIPRPETELLVEKAIECAQRYEMPLIADIGTGCGAIAISLAFNLPRARVIATDISPQALETARRNCERHGVHRRVTLLKGDLLKPLTQPADIIVANLPYVRTAELPAVNTHGWEPCLALDGGEDGLDIIRRLCVEVSRMLRPGGALLLEIGAGQKEAVVEILQDMSPGTTETTRAHNTLRLPNYCGHHSGGGQNPEDKTLGNSNPGTTPHLLISSHGEERFVLEGAVAPSSSGPHSRPTCCTRTNDGESVFPHTQSPSMRVDVFQDLAGIDRVVCMTLRR